MSIKNSTIVVASLILFGRITGFTREWLISSISGANEQTDIAVVLLTFPDLIVNLILGGGFSTSLIPFLKVPLFLLSIFYIISRLYFLRQFGL